MSGRRAPGGPPPDAGRPAAAPDDDDFGAAEALALAAPRASHGGPAHDGDPGAHDGDPGGHGAHGGPAHGGRAHGQDPAGDDLAALTGLDGPAPARPHGPHSDAPGAHGDGGPHSGPDGRARHGIPWAEARGAARSAGRVTRGRPPVPLPLDDALGLVLASPVSALTDLPSFTTSAMDGWAVAGPGPWDVRGDGALAGGAEPERLADGEAVRIATGARVPREATAVLRSEHGRHDRSGRLFPTRTVTHGQDIRPRGQECRSGELLLPAGVLVTPAVLGLAAAAGYDVLLAVPRPRAEVFVLGDELLTEGRPRDGLIRDALGPMLPPWLRALGAEVTAVRRLGDDTGDTEALHRAVSASRADLVVTTGGTAGGPRDQIHPLLRRIGAELLVDGVQVRPGHPMLLARTKENQHLVGLPGNPLAAVSGLLTLAAPLLRTLAGRGRPDPYIAPVHDDVHGHPVDTRLVPVTLRGDQAVPLRYNGPAMLRGIAAADALAVVPPGGARRGQELELLELPWADSGIGECFT